MSKMRQNNEAKAWQRDLIEVTRRFRFDRALLEKVKAKLFPKGSRVYVEHEKYVGQGVVTLDSSCPTDKIAVKVESGNVWYYPIECCSRSSVCEHCYKEFYGVTHLCKD